MDDRDARAPTILIVDDQRSARTELARMVEELGYVALCVDSPLECPRLVRDGQVALVLLDVMMPTFDGFKLAALIKAQPRFVPVMLLTGLTDIESKRRGQAAGADDFLSKPVDPMELKIRIDAMLRIKRLTDELNDANRRLAEHAETDGLTGLGNRRAFDVLYPTEFERAERYARPLSLLVIDIDHFKRVNDTHGHIAGDEALRAVASAIRRMLRRSDRVVRFGGEEFVVIAPETNPQGAAQLGDRIRNGVELLRVTAEDAVLRLTVSVGAASWDGAVDLDAEGLLRQADEALYEAKESGRNRVRHRLIQARPSR